MIQAVDLSDFVVAVSPIEVHDVVEAREVLKASEVDSNDDFQQQAQKRIDRRQ
jgi:uncharacterized protein (DUF1778 family)